MAVPERHRGGHAGQDGERQSGRVGGAKVFGATTGNKAAASATSKYGGHVAVYLKLKLFGTSQSTRQLGTAAARIGRSPNA